MMEYYLAIKKNEIMSNVAITRNYHTKQSKSEREKQTPCVITYRWNFYVIEADPQTQRKDLWLPRGRAGGEGVDWEFGISRCKLLYIGWINSKVLLYSTGNCIKHPVINHNGKV